MYAGTTCHTTGKLIAVSALNDARNIWAHRVSELPSNKEKRSRSYLTPLFQKMPVTNAMITANKLDSLASQVNCD